ncbi:unnamed protein product [Lactuca saligna]|uniref:non-specific serine/threonine protein kinase n=1 Tax=Lactuca saligna TaxID=75948 RepID=A0AA35YTV2_LACSI|nr:unnamed protein product [Lactuca saligna]
MKQPPGFIDSTYQTHVCRLKKALYGLKLAPRAWFQRPSSFLLQVGFTFSRADPSLFMLKQGSYLLFLLVYVDDIILTGNNSETISTFITRLHKEFAIKDLGRLSYFLGIDVLYTSDGLFLTQTKYALDILARAGLLDGKPVYTPLATFEPLIASGESFHNPTLYRSLVGALQYLTITHPDLSYAINQVSQFLHAPTMAHFQAVKHILRYVRGTVAYGLTYKRSPTIPLVAYSDADWARCTDTRRSTYGYSIFLGGNLVSWSAKKQPTVSRLSRESEYRAIANTASEVIWITHLLRELHIPISSLPLLYSDNKSAIFLSQNPVAHKRAKHIDLDYHFVRELVTSGKLHTRFIPTTQMVADLFTKSLPRPLFEYFRSKLCVGPPPSSLTGAKYSTNKPKSSHQNPFVIIGLPVIAAGLIISVFICCYIRKKKANQSKHEILLGFSDSLKSVEGSFMKKDFGENVDLHVFDLSTIVAATDNFSFSNKLGEGGFGSVYKGKLLNGQEIAVKRLSQGSGQGMHEFTNEVTLIAKLQHRNLVRLLGYCFHKEEKMLIYEYLPNKGLDSFIFDQEKGCLLDWKKRFLIIRGIVRGLLYLHQDSRLRIIHRDLKASNVLLDADLNPKISDFGMAKIFGSDQDQAITRRVVGTYGYMSPEYAMEGLFSVKSDVYSFGILVLEIISGRKNNSYYLENSVNLVGHVWDLWKQDKALTVVDSSLGDAYDAREILLCIHVGILCVQESSTDRPTMTDVAFMLSNRETKLPTPNQPAYIFRQLNYGTDSTTASASCGDGSVYDRSITTVHAR